MLVDRGDDVLPLSLTFRRWSSEPPRAAAYATLCAVSSAQQGGTVGYLAGALALAFVLFGWPMWPVGWILVTLFLAADLALET